MKSTLLNLQQKASSLLTLFEPGETYTTSSMASLSGYSQNRAREIMNVLMTRGYLVRDTEHREYKYRLIKTVSEIDTMFDFVSVLKLFDEEKLETFLEALHETRKRREGAQLTNTFIDPLTGESLTLDTFPVRVSCHTSKPKKDTKPRIDTVLASDSPVVPNSNVDDGALEAAQRLQSLKSDIKNIVEIID